MEEEPEEADAEGDGDGDEEALLLRLLRLLRRVIGRRSLVPFMLNCVPDTGVGEEEIMPNQHFTQMFDAQVRSQSIN